MADGSTILRRNRPGTKAKVSTVRPPEPVPVQAQAPPIPPRCHKWWISRGRGVNFPTLVACVKVATTMTIDSVPHPSGLVHLFWGGWNLFVVLMVLSDFCRTFPTGPMNRSRRWTARLRCSSTFSRWSRRTPPAWSRFWRCPTGRTRVSGNTNISGIALMLWKGERCSWISKNLFYFFRQFCMELNGLAVRLQTQCFPATCTQMTATEQWIFLCAAHKTPKECPAIDYTRHTLDGAACLLNSNKYFPSRYIFKWFLKVVISATSVGFSSRVSIKESSVSKLGSVCRRVYRIFSHAYYHHRRIFNEFEEETYLCLRFTHFVTKYSLMSKENLIVPIPECELTPGESEA